MERITAQQARERQAAAIAARAAEEEENCAREVYDRIVDHCNLKETGSLTVNRITRDLAAQLVKDGFTVDGTTITWGG